MLTTLLLLAFPATAGIGVAANGGAPFDDEPITTTVTVTVTTTVVRTHTVVSAYRGVSAPRWAAKYRHMRHLAYARLRVARAARRTLLASSSVTEAINLAGATYGFTSTLWRKARCESGLDPSAQNPSEASGLLQFLPSTFASTPYGSFSIWSPYANALAAGWMHAHGRGGEWSCR